MAHSSLIATQQAGLRRYLSDEEAGRLTALMRVIPESATGCIRTMLNGEPPVDLVQAVNAVVSSKADDPIRTKGVHQRGLIAIQEMREFLEGWSFELPFPPITWYREGRDACYQPCCEGRGLVKQSFSLTRFVPPVIVCDPGRRTAVLAYAALTPGICNRDWFVLFTTSAKKREHTLFDIRGWYDLPDGKPAGVRVDANVKLYDMVHNFKRALVAIA